MQSRTFYGISVAIVVLVSLYVLVWAGLRAAPALPPILTDIFATSTLGSLGFMDINTPNGTIHAVIASTSAAREEGLSGMPMLAKDSGMLFVFPNAGSYGFWMKDMNFPIDMVWIGADKKVRGVVFGAATSTYPNVFYPPAPVPYVLELDSGGARDHRIATGTELVF